MGTELHYKAGSFYRVCDKTGFPTRAERTQREWQGLIVRKEVFEPRQPQDFVRGVNDIQTVPQPRPRPTNVFLGPISTTLTATVAAGGSSLPVVSTAGMSNGDKLTVILDTGAAFATVISSPPATTSLTCSPVLPFSASSGNLITDLSAGSTASIG